MEKPLDAVLSTEEVLKILRYPLAVCDGGRFGIREDTIISELIRSKIDFCTEQYLYDSDDISRLSQYGTIAFGTYYCGAYDRLLRLFDFDKANLKVIIPLTVEAFGQIKDMVEPLGITCIAFSTGLRAFFDPYKANYFQEG